MLRVLGVLVVLVPAVCGVRNERAAPRPARSRRLRAQARRPRRHAARAPPPVRPPPRRPLPAPRAGLLSRRRAPLSLAPHARGEHDPSEDDRAPRGARPRDRPPPGADDVRALSSDRLPPRLQ